MSRHPVTPADESDLRLHLAKQTAKSIGLVDVLDLALPIEECRARLAAKVASGDEIVLFDSLTFAHVQTIGRLLDMWASDVHPLFSVGSSSVETGVAAKWQKLAHTSYSWPNPGMATPILIASGSCSPITGGQVDWAVGHGFEQIILDDNDRRVASAADECAKRLSSGVDVVLHTGGANERSSRAEVPWGKLVGRAVRGALEKLQVTRVCICGGDTASHAARELGIESLEFKAPLTPGAPVCQAKAPGSPADGVEFVFKGGQVGASNYFGVVARGACGNAMGDRP
jgi:uncharacterized protein YgbK (DUF1537 family)